MEIYLKQGVGGAGQFQVYMTPDDGIRVNVFDIYNTTYNSGCALDGFEHLYPLKLYTNKPTINNIYDKYADLQVYWDDFELWRGKP